MKTSKRITALVLALVLCLALAACGGKGDGPKKATIGVGFFSASGNATVATKEFLAGLEEKLNVSFQYTVLSQTDEAQNISKVQELIAAGCDGIIITMDMGMDSILAECKAADVYVAGFLCDFDSSYRNNYDGVFKHPNFLGSVADGDCGEDVTRGYAFFDSLIEYNEKHTDAPIKHVSMCTFPSYAFPLQQTYVKQFTEKLDEYNTANPDKAIEYDPYDTETDVLQFRAMDSTYFSKHEGVDAIISFCSGTMVYPSMVSAGKDKTIKLFASGYGDGDNAVFGSKGAFQTEMVSGVEAIVYPLVLLLNKINGVEFPDQPAEAERRSCASFIINSDEDMALFEKNIYLTAKAEDALLSADDVYNMTAFGNENATYADLVAFLSHMTIDDLK